MDASDLLTPSQAAAHLLPGMETAPKAAVFLVVDHPDKERIGGRVLFIGDERFGSLQDPMADSAAAALALAGISGDSKILPGLHSLALNGGGEAVIYLELHHPALEMVVVGAGHLAQPLCTVGALLGMRVSVLDDRPDFATRERFPEAHDVSRVDFSDPFPSGRLHPWSHVLLVTRGHRYDFQCLRKVLQHDPFPAYIGMIGSRRRVRATFDALLEAGFPRSLLSQVRAPIGLDLGGQTPAEIAVSVAAEIVMLWRGGTGGPLRDAEAVLDRLCPGEGGAMGSTPREDADD